MILRLVILLCLSFSACAELPPVVGNAGIGNSGLVANAPKSSPASANYEMLRRLEQMQTEIQQLTGKVEEQAFQIDELKKQQKTMYTDFDDRLQTLENKSGSDQAAAVTPPVDSSSDTGSASDPVESTKPPADEQDKPESKTSEPSTSDAAVNKSAASAPASELSSTSATAPAQVSEVEKQEYQQAYDDLRNGKTADAITGFNAYLTNHPGSGYASNAQYWLGEAYRVNLDNASARTAFNAVVDNYPNSAKVPDALYKLGIIEMEEKNSAKAREIMTRITTEFANSKAAVLAQKKLQTLQ